MNTCKNKITVALDLDGVIWDLVRPWITEYNNRFGDNLSYDDVTSYDLTRHMKKCTKEDYCHILSEILFWQKVEPFSGNSEWLRKLNKRFNLVIATKTDYRLFEMKVNRVLELFPFIKHSQIINIHDKSLLNVDWLVDDCLDNLKRGDFNAVVYDAPYNKSEKYFRVKSLEEFYNLLEQYYNESKEKKWQNSKL